MMKFVEGRFVFGCQDDECSIFIHKILLVPETTNETGTVYAEVLMHKDIHGHYYCLSSIGTRQEIEH